MHQWTKDLAVGIEEIDKQHQALFDHANRLFAAAKQGREITEIENVFAFLEEYATKHFNLEEAYMDRYMYSDAEVHKAKHGDFLMEFRKIKSEYRRSNAPSYIMLIIEGWLYKWMSDHFSGEDKLLGEFLKKRI